ncbi:pentapeptide repeat-containing protein [Shewanella sp. Arc9-LZ]|uniref:pentapeptide repeat-containing protein n=1 Tax=Shewanella sp. Arc9-LZ TaxID=2698686 RepID=UPI00137BB859|nr:pentapeptide repeat-containing protein [Shewanella sp. Arc9-LZ]QHS12906.1 pentapeptide repeat-containing protein [Shewanella sp. Arc9-LZ]
MKTISNTQSSELFGLSHYSDDLFESIKGVALQFKNITFERCHFTQCDFSQSDFYHCHFIECVFSQCNLSVMSVVATEFDDVTFSGCKAIGIDWTKAEWPQFMTQTTIKFERCMLNGSNFYSLHLPEFSLVDCRAHDVDFREANLSKADLRMTDFNLSQFSHTNLTGANFTDALNYQIDITANNVKQAIFSRFEALSLLEGLDIQLVD